MRVTMDWLSLLPAELILLILEELPYADLLRCQRVCKQLRKLIQGSAAPKYRVELTLAGMDDVPSSMLSVAAKRELLSRHTKSYKKWPKDSTTQQTIALLEGPLWELCGGVLAQSDGRRDLDFWQLPSNIRGIPVREWGVDVGFDIADFTLDPAQDLLVAVEVQSPTCIAHALTLATGEPHRDAAVQRMTFPLPPFDIPNRSYHLRICGDYLGILIRVYDLMSDEPHTVFGVTNWKTGESKLLTAYWGILSFAFLDPTHIIILRSAGQIPEINPQHEGGTATVLVSIIDFMRPVPPNEVNEAPHCPCITLRLPTIADRWEVWHAEVVCDPAPGCPPSQTSTSRSSSSSSSSSSDEQPSNDQHPTPPFHVSMNDRIVVIRINGVDTLFEQGDSIDIFIHASSLISLLTIHTSARPLISSPLSPSLPLQSSLLSSGKDAISVPTPEPDEISWEAWGPTLTRVLPATVPACVWCYPAYGMKFAGQSEGHVTILDFNRVAVRQSLCATAASSSPSSSSAITAAVPASPESTGPGSGSAVLQKWNGAQEVEPANGIEVSGEEVVDADMKEEEDDEGETVMKANRYSRQFFKDVVRSSLPYRKFKTDLKIAPGEFVMINEDSVLLVKEDSKEFRIMSL